MPDGKEVIMVKLNVATSKLIAYTYANEIYL